MTQITSSPGTPTKIVEDVVQGAEKLAASVEADVASAVKSIDSSGAAGVATKAASVVSTATADVQKAVVEYGFVRANWGKLSIIVVAAAIVGFIVGHVL